MQPTNSPYRTIEKPMMQPTANNVLVKREKAETVSTGGIIIPDNAQKKSEKCIVVAAGPGKPLDNGERAPMPVNAGDVVMIPQWRGVEVKVEGEDMLIVKEDECMAVYE